jgi:Leucine-rich repeat (LRR) protein
MKTFLRLAIFVILIIGSATGLFCKKKEPQTGELESSSVEIEAEPDETSSQLETSDDSRTLIVTYTYDGLPWREEIDVRGWEPGEYFCMIYGYQTYPYWLLPWQGQDSIHINKGRVLVLDGIETGVVILDDYDWKKMLKDPATILTAKVDIENVQEIRNFPNLEAVVYLSSTSSFPGHRDRDLKYLKEVPKLKAFYLAGNFYVTDKGLKHLAELEGLQWLVLHSGYVTDAGLVNLSNLKSLTYLELHVLEISDTGLVHLAGLKNLKELYIYGSGYKASGSVSPRVTDEGLVHLSHLTRLRKLDLSECHLITGPGLAHLSNLNELRELNLYRTRIENDALAYLSGLTNLRKLRLDYTSITGEGLKYISGLSKLEYLNLHNIPIGDEKLTYIAKLRNLRVLDLSYTHLTPEVLAHLENLTELRELYLDDNDLDGADFSALSQLTKLERLGLSNMYLEKANLATLANLKNLKEINLVHSDISSKDYKILHEALPDCRMPMMP